MRLWIALISVGAVLPAIAALACPAQSHSTPAKAAAPQAYVGRGYRYLERRLYAKAAEEFQAALSIDPHLIEARYQMAICEFALGHLDDARRQFLQVESESSGNPQAIYYLGRIDVREANYSRATHELLKIVSAPPFPDTAYYLGSAYLYEGNLPQAEQWLQAAAKLNPHDFRVADHLARVYQKEKQTARAEQEYANSSRLRRYYDRAAADAVACDRALNTHRLHKTDAACRRLFDSQDQDKLILVGTIYGRHGDYEDAVRPLETAVRLDPDSWAAEYNLGLTYFRLRRYSNAVPPLHRAVDLRPEYFGSSALLGAALYTLKQDQEAFRVLKHAHELNPGDSDTAGLLFNESLVLARQSYFSRNYSECLKLLLEASALRPADRQVQRRIVEVERLVGSRSRTSTEEDELLDNKRLRVCLLPHGCAGAPWE